jgi:hypothetical protein
VGVWAWVWVGGWGGGNCKKLDDGREEEVKRRWVLKWRWRGGTRRWRGGGEEVKGREVHFERRCRACDGSWREGGEEVGLEEEVERRRRGGGGFGVWGLGFGGAEEMEGRERRWQGGGSWDGGEEKGKRRSGGGAEVKRRWRRGGEEVGLEEEVARRWRVWVWGLGFGVWGLGFGFGFWVLGFGFWVLGFGFGERRCRVVKRRWRGGEEVLRKAERRGDVEEGRREMIVEEDREDEWSRKLEQRWGGEDGWAARHITTTKTKSRLVNNNLSEQGGNLAGMEEARGNISRIGEKLMLRGRCVERNLNPSWGNKSEMRSETLTCVYPSWTEAVSYKVRNVAAENQMRKIERLIGEGKLNEAWYEDMKPGREA